MLSFFFILLELVARFYLPAPNKLQILSQKTEEKNLFFNSVYSRRKAGLYYNSPVGIRLTKNISGIIKNHFLSHQDVKIKTNKQGFRYKELNKKSKKDFRILVLGDSITLADYVQYNETYPASAETFLKRNPLENGFTANKNI